MKYKIILLITTLLISANLAYSQINGYVMAKSGEALPYVNIVLLNESDSVFVEGTISNENGYFHFEKYNSSSPLTIRFSAIGYGTLTFPIAQLQEKVVLQDETALLGEVTVKAARPVYKMRGTSLLVNVQNSIMKDLGSANDVIERLPGVKGGDGSFQLFGKGTAVIYINSRMVKDSKELERLNSNNIESIEIIKNPGAEYDASTKAVIKIKLKRNENDGFSGTATLQVKQGERFSDVEYVQLAYNATHINTFLSVGNYSTRMCTDQRNKNITYTPNIVWNMNTDMMDWNNRFYTQALTAGLSYTPNKKHIMGGSLSYTDNSDRYGGMSFSEVERESTLYENLESENSTRNDYKQWIGNMYYDGQVNKLEINFNGDYVHRTSNGAENSLEEGNLTPSHLIRNLSDATYDIYAGRLTFSYQFSTAGTLSLGLDGSHLKENKSTIGTDDETVSSESSIGSEETKYAAFTNYKWNYKKLSLQMGLRYEELTTKYKDKSANQDLVNKTNRRLYPSIQLSLPVGQTEMALNYTTKVKRPTFYQLRNSIEYTNRYSMDRGNPYLQPQYTSDITYSLQYKDWQMSVAYQYVEDYLGTQNIIATEDPLKAISNPINIPHYHALQGEILYHPVIGCWRPQVSFNIMRTYLDIYDNDGKKINNNLPYWECSFVNAFRFPHQWSMFADVYYTADGNSMEYRIKPYAYANLGVSKYLFNKSLMISLSIYDVFHSNKEKEIRYCSNDIFEKWRYRDKQQVRLNIRYSLYKNKKKYKGKNVSADEINRL